jgi:hypothetical protein
MSEKHPKDKAEGTVKKLKGRKPPEYRAFEEMLKTVIKAPPMKKR